MSDKDSVFKANSIYVDLCEAGERGIRIGDLKKKYKLSNTNIRVLIDYLIYQSDIGEIPPFEIIRKGSEPDVEDEEETEEDQDTTELVWDNDCVLCIYDEMVKFISKDIDANMFQNPTLLKQIQNTNIFDTSDNKVLPDMVIDKNDKTKKNKEADKVLMRWIDACMYDRILEINQRENRWSKNREVLPLGVYFERLLGTYMCVYRTKSRIDEMDLDMLLIVDEKEELEEGEQFNIRDYLRNIRTETMVLKVYHKEAKVYEKLRKLLADYELSIEEHEEYVIMSCKVKESMQYLDLIRGFGKSVLVLEPTELRDDIMGAIKEALTLYESLS